jgi:hypothetical protein
MTEYYKVDGLCGSAKTYTALRYAITRAGLGLKFIIVQPTMSLIAETLKDCASLDHQVPFRAIHGGTTGNVVGDIIAHAKAAQPGGELLFITHSAFMLLPYFDRRHLWHVIWDELPQADFCEELNVPNSHRLITDLIAVDPEAQNLADNRYAPVIANDRRGLQAIARNVEGDQVWTVFQQFAQKVVSDHWSAYVLDDQFCNLVEGDGQCRKLLTFAHLKPSLFAGFATATIMGACFEESVLFHLWTAMGVKFRTHTAIQSRLRYQRHDNGDLLTIRYATEESWSKNFRDKPLTGDQAITVFDQVIERVKLTVAGVDFVWMGNKDNDDRIFDGRGHRLPNSPHGLNPYQHIHHAVVLAALNPPPAHFSFLDALGLDSSEVKRAGYWQATYQAAMRISLRNPADRNPKTVTVMDRATADWLAAMFPGCTIEALGLNGMPSKGKPGRPREYASTADRKRAHRDQFKAELRAALDLVNDVGCDGRMTILARQLREQMSEFGFGRDKKLSTMGHTDLHAMAGTLFTSIYEREPFEFMPLGDAETFIEGLRHLHAHEVPSKDQNGLISPAIFDPGLSGETGRGLANIRAIWGIWLDNDGGDLSPKQFARMFPRLRMAIFNSYSSTRQLPRWRVFIPTTIAMPIAAHKAIVGQIMRTVNDAGYWSKEQLAGNRRIRSGNHHGFDMSKLTPSSLFYWPVQASDPADSFFDDHNEAKRLPLDPYVWSDYASNHALPEPEQIIAPVVELPAATPLPATISPKMRALSENLRAHHAANANADLATRRDRAIQKWRAEGTAPHVGNRKFFDLARDLANAGMGDAEIVGILNSEAGFSRSPADRRKQVKSIMRSIRRPKAA